MNQSLRNTEVDDAVLAFYQQVNANHVWLGFSGGLDSTVLLHALVKQCPATIHLTALHVHHGLQDCADDWVLHCQKVCASLNVEFVVRYINVDKRDNIESAARNARYQVFSDCVADHEVLCLAHHQRDQAETFLLNLMRGAGVAGLSAMPQKRMLSSNHQAWLWRPLLDVAYNRLHEYALQNNLVWVEDITNQDTQLRRNFIRRQLLPVLQQHWPASNHKIAQASDHLAEAAVLLADLAQQDLTDIPHDKYKLDWQALQEFSLIRQKNILQYWFQSNHQLRIDAATLDWLSSVCFQAPAGAEPKRKLSVGEIRRYQQFMFYVVENEQPFSFENLGFSELEESRFRLQLTRGEGVAQKWFQSPHSVRVRCLLPTDKVNRVSLKKWFQTQHIPPWQRRLWPVLVIDDQLAAIANYRVMSGFEAEITENGLKLVGLN